MQGAMQVHVMMYKVQGACYDVQGACYAGACYAGGHASRMHIVGKHSLVDVSFTRNT